MLKAILTYSFLQNALLAAFLASIVCGIVGTIIVEKKLVMLSGGIAHASFGGIGLGYLLNIEPIWGGLLFAVVASLASAGIKRRTCLNIDAIIGMFWSVGMSLGIVFIALTPGYPPNMTSYLFGDILTVSRDLIYIMILLDTVIVIAIMAFISYWKAYLFDEEFTFILGLPVNLLENMLFLLIGLAIVVLIRVVGIILSIALLTIPPAIAKHFFSNLTEIICSAIVIGIALCMLGLFLSYQYNIASGAAIVLVSGSVNVLIIVMKNGLAKLRRFFINVR